MNVLLMLFAAHAGLKKLSSVRDGWGDTVKDMILTARSFVDSALCSEAEKVFNEKDWVVSLLQRKSEVIVVNRPK